MAKRTSKKGKRHKQLFGIAEWYGLRFTDLSSRQRKQLADAKNIQMKCPFFEQVPSLAPKAGNRNCNKKGGICSLRNFQPPDDTSGHVTFGQISATCPNRFLEGGIVAKHIGEYVLGTSDPLFAKEIAFLMRPNSSRDRNFDAETVNVSRLVTEITSEEMAEEGNDDPLGSDKEDVGRIDLVFVHPENPEKWCAVEMQAVYFSGGEIAKDLKVIREMSDTDNNLPLPGATRRPDFRSSGPKRLMPQLQIKVPTLRRWGKKMVVVIDRPFHDSMDALEHQDHISNCDIIWVVVRYDEDHSTGEARLAIDKTINTTLDDAIKALTAGKPTTLPKFEEKLASKLTPVFERPSTQS